VTIDLDATLLGAHSEKEGAAGNFKGGFGFHPMLAYFDESSEAAAGMLRAGNAGANTAADQIAVAEAALEQIPTERVEGIDILLRVDSAGAVHELLEWAHEGGIGFSVGFDLTEQVRVRGEGVLAIPGDLPECRPRRSGRPTPVLAREPVIRQGSAEAVVAVGSCAVKGRTRSRATDHGARAEAITAANPVRGLRAMDA
jgi:hypothetical protein